MTCTYVYDDGTVCEREPRPGMTRCPDHRLSWKPYTSVEPRLPEWRRRASVQPHGLARPLDRSHA